MLIPLSNCRLDGDLTNPNSCLSNIPLIGILLVIILVKGHVFCSMRDAVYGEFLFHRLHLLI